MTITVAHLCRHPIKAHGREALERVTLQKGATMPWDRTWAIAHEGARLSGTEWASCANFSRGAKAPQLMAIETTLNEKTEALTLRHPSLPELTVHPDRDQEELVAWVNQLMPEDRAQSSHVVRTSERGMTDSDFASVSIAGLASHNAVEGLCEQPLSRERWRANIWLDGLGAWDEFNWVGKTIAIGEVEFDIRQQITRCLATTANPETGERDANTLGALKQLGHQEFGVYGFVTKGGDIALGDQVRIA